MDHRVIHLHVMAPPKPAWGESCNGCGLCCAAEPCPMGSVLSRRRQGRCVALDWDEAGQRYICGLLARPHRWLPWLRLLPEAALRRMIRRWIAAGAGCDSDLEAA